MFLDEFPGEETALDNGFRFCLRSKCLFFSWIAWNVKVESLVFCLGIRHLFGLS